MQNNDLLVFLVNTAGPEAGQLINDAIDILTSVGATAHSFNIEQALMTQSVSDDNETLGIINKSIIDELVYRLQEFGVVFSDHQIPHMTYCLQGLTYLSEYGDPTTIWNITIDDGCAEEKFCNIMEFVSPYRWVDLIDIVESVSSDLIFSIRDICANNARTAENQEEFVSPILVVSKDIIRNRLLDFANDRKDYLIFNLIAEGAPIGLDPDLYIQELRETLTELSGMDIVDELYAIRLCSNLTDEQITNSLDVEVETITSDMKKLTDASIRISQL